MKNDDFYLFLNNVFDNYLNNNADNYIDYSKYSDAPHEFSAKHKRKMDRLIRRQKRFYFPVIKTGVRRIITVTMILILMMFSAVMSVEAWRSAFISFITKPFTTHTDVKTAADKSAPTVIERNYEPAFIPDGFILSEKSDIKELRNSRIFVNSKNDNEIIDFEQWVKEEYTPSVNTEGYGIEPVDVNGCEGFIIDMEKINCCLISWDHGDYVFQITGNVDRDTIVKIARSVI